MRVVMLVHNMVGHGTFNRAHSLARNLVRSGNDVTLYAGATAARSAQNELREGVRLICGYDPLPPRARESGLSPFELASRLRRMRHQRCDIVHCFDHRPTVSAPGFMLARRNRVPLIFDWADHWGFGGIAAHRRLPARLTLGCMDQWLENYVRRYADGLTVISTALRDRTRAQYNVPVR